jgi:hypothetical protein
VDHQLGVELRDEGRHAAVGLEHQALEDVAAPLLPRRHADLVRRATGSQTTTARAPAVSGSRGVLVCVEPVSFTKGIMRLSPLPLVLACAAYPGGASRLDRVPTGAWGGEHVRLTVTDTGGTIEFDCAHGSLDEPLTLDANGRFDVSGRLIQEGGPTQKDESSVARPARFSGESGAERMSLQVTQQGGESAGSFSLVKDGPARLFKCR